MSRRNTRQKRQNTSGGRARARRTSHAERRFRRKNSEVNAVRCVYAVIAGKRKRRKWLRRRHCARVPYKTGKVAAAATLVTRRGSYKVDRKRNKKKTPRSVFVTPVVPARRSRISSSPFCPPLRGQISRPRGRGPTTSSLRTQYYLDDDRFVYCPVPIIFRSLTDSP